jgi:putative nucleotidyltransferase with HDIG domain
MKSSNVPMRLWRDDRLSNHAQVVAQRLLVDLPDRWAHTQAVATLTGQVARRLDLASEHILLSAAWLHDCGYSSEAYDTGFHPIDGAEYASSHTFPVTVVSLIAHHTGAWSEAFERGLVADLARFALPPRDFLDIVTYADLHVGRTGVAVDPRARINEILDRYPPTDPVYRAVQRSKPLLLAAVARVRLRLDSTDCQFDERP